MFTVSSVCKKKKKKKKKIRYISHTKKKKKKKKKIPRILIDKKVTLGKHAYSNILKILQPKQENFQIKYGFFSMSL